MNVDPMAVGNAGTGAVIASPKDAGVQATEEQRSGGSPLPSNKYSIKLRSGRWRLINEREETASLKVRVETTTKRHGVLSLDFAKLVTEPKMFAVFEFECGGDSVGLDRIKLPEDLREFVLHRLLIQGVPLLYKHCVALGLVTLVRDSDSWCTPVIHAKLVAAQALADAARLHDATDTAGLSMMPLLELPLVQRAERAFNAAAISVAVLAAVCGVTAPLLDTGGRIFADLQEQKYGTVQNGLLSCREALHEACLLLGNGDCLGV